MPDAIALDLRARREAVIRAHADAENRRDATATLKTFHKPRYEVVPLGDPVDGAGNVHDLLKGLFEGFPISTPTSSACTTATASSPQRSASTARIAAPGRPTRHRPQYRRARAEPVRVRRRQTHL